MKIALVHDYLSQNGGAEQVLKALHDLYPEAPIYTLFYDPTKFGDMFAGADIRESVLGHFPGIKNHYRWFLPLMPFATELYDLSEFDVVISSVSAFAKGIITSPETLHICYCHTPTRYLWSDTHAYVDHLKLSPISKLFVQALLGRHRSWDRLAADRVDFFIANSKTVEGRIKKYYRRESEIVYPPVNVAAFADASGATGNYFLAGGRLVAYKKFDWIIEACNRLKMPLKIFGEGVAEKHLRALTGPTVEFLGRVDAVEQKKLYAECRAYIQPQVEDFGMTAVEAMACGRPVIALPEGGSTETIVHGVTGIFMRMPGWEGVLDALLSFDSYTWDNAVIRAHAAQFSTEVFAKKITSIVETTYTNHAHR